MRKYLPEATCTVDGCDRRPEARELCHGHFEYQRRTGRRPTKPFADRSPEARFRAKINVLPVGHWIWTGATASGGIYGAMQYDGRVQPAHRVAWMLFRGPIPDGYEIDHVCRKTLCVNPDHLEPVTPRVNVLRSESIQAHNAAKTHCKRGHEFTPENIRPMGTRGRQCRACMRSPEGRAANARRQREYRARQKIRRVTHETSAS